MSRVLVCGGRNYKDADKVNSVLDKLHKDKNLQVVIHGGARGADSLAGIWAATQWIEDKSVEEVVFQAFWDTYGKGAGPIRNQKMLLEGKPDLVVAFPGGKGTENMINLAKKAKIEVMEVK